MPRQRPKWKRPTPKPRVVVSMPQSRVVAVPDTELMKKVAEDVVLVMANLEAKHNTGAF